MLVKKYSAEQKESWNAVNKTSKNGLFFFDRDFMDYHSDRFKDHSLFFELENKIVAILPASEHGKSVVCHGGLTFGYLLYDGLTVEQIKGAMTLACEYYKSLGFEDLTLKVAPLPFQRRSSDELSYALHNLGFQNFRKDLSNCLDLKNRFPFAENLKRKIKKAESAGIQVQKTQNAMSAIEIISQVLAAVHKAKPVHSADELNRLRDAFPENIEIYEARLGAEILATTVVFHYGDLIHTQYLANSETGRNLGALDLILSSVIKEYGERKRYLNFGISTENSGEYLNEGLYRFKNSFGGGGLVYDFYKKNLKD